MWEMLIEFGETYGITLLIIALSGIFLLGVLKFYKVFDAIEKGRRKYIYAALSALLSLGAITVYLLITGSFTWELIGGLALAVFVLNQGAYSLYENMGVRAAWRWFWSKLLSMVARSIVDEKIMVYIDKFPEDPAALAAEIEKYKAELKK